MDAEACDRELETASPTLATEEMTFSEIDEAGETTDSCATEESVGTTLSRTTEDAVEPVLSAANTTCSVTEEPTDEIEDTASLAAEDATEATLDADGRCSLRVATGLVVGTTAGKDSDSDTTSGSTGEADPTAASEGSGTKGEEDLKTDRTADDTEAEAFETDAATVSRACCACCVRGVAWLLPSSFTRSQIFLTCGSTNWRRCSPRNCKN